jgi:hypothetical protein
MQQDILTSTKKIINNAQYIAIPKDSIESFCTTFSLRDLDTKALGAYSQTWDLEKVISTVCLFNCINFYFWASKGGPKWQVEVKGETLDGAAALFRVLEEALAEGVPLLDAQYLSEINREKLGTILKGNIEIPFLDERVQCLREAGQVLLDKFDGNFMNVIEAAKGDAIELTDLFIKHFSSFDDFSMLDGTKVEFHKRAQLNADMVLFRMRKAGKDVSNMDKLTAFADYKVPQMLRKLGILEYVPSLAEKVDSYTEIPQGSREEIEIRAATVWALENMKETLSEKHPEVTTRALDDHLWHMGQVKHLDEKPYHRTKTVYY